MSVPAVLEMSYASIRRIGSGSRSMACRSRSVPLRRSAALVARSASSLAFFDAKSTNRFPSPRCGARMATVFSSFSRRSCAKGAASSMGAGSRMRLGAA